MKKWIYVRQYGWVWKLSRAAYKRLLKKIAESSTYDLDDFGRCIGECTSVLDVGREEAKELLKAF